MKNRKKEKKKESFGELTRSLFFAIILAMIFRSFLFEPFYIPSGSMKSTLLVGDYVFVSKYKYGYSRYSFPFGPPIFDGRKLAANEPQRGDVVVFKLPTNTSTNYIKRLIGLPGDEIQVTEGVLYLNGKEVTRERIDNFIDSDGKEIPQYIETLPSGVSYQVLDEKYNGGLDNTGIYKVPDDHYFFMGDNRDNSQDSRVLNHVGFVPKENLLGPANIIFSSTSANLFKFWEWISGFRSDRFLNSVAYEGDK